MHFHCQFRFVPLHYALIYSPPFSSIVGRSPCRFLPFLFLDILIARLTGFLERLSSIAKRCAAGGCASLFFFVFFPLLRRGSVSFSFYYYYDFFSVDFFSFPFCLVVRESSRPSIVGRRRRGRCVRAVAISFLVGIAWLYRVLLGFYRV